MLVKIIKTSSTLREEAKKRNSGDSYYSFTSSYVILFANVDLCDFSVCVINLSLYVVTTTGVSNVEFLDITDCFKRTLSLVSTLFDVAMTKL